MTALVDCWNKLDEYVGKLKTWVATKDSSAPKGGSEISMEKLESQLNTLKTMFVEKQKLESDLDACSLSSDDKGFWRITLGGAVDLRGATPSESPIFIKWQYFDLIYTYLYKRLWSSYSFYLFDINSFHLRQFGLKMSSATDSDSGDRIIRLEIWGLKDCHFEKTFIDDEMKR